MLENSYMFERGSRPAGDGAQQDRRRLKRDAEPGQKGGEAADAERRRLEARLMRDQGRPRVRRQRRLAQANAADRVGEVARGRGDERERRRREAIERQADK